MAEPPSGRLSAPPIPDSAAIARAEDFTSERFLHPGEDAAEALHAKPPTARASLITLFRRNWGGSHAMKEPRARRPRRAFQESISPCGS